MHRLENKIMLVAGAGGGFGGGLARRFASEGAAVVHGDVDVAGATAIVDGGLTLRP
jgi:3-oxoacyl-[acyl-carrier protein] reductase